MRGRSHLSERERSARSRLTQLRHEDDLIAGSTVLMKHTCGKKSCKCARGEKHESLYLATSRNGKRTMVSIRPDLARRVTAAVQTYQRFKPLLQALSEECVVRLVKKAKE